MRAQVLKVPRETHSDRPRSTRHTGARPPVKVMQLGPGPRASLGVAARARRQRTKRRRTSAGARSAPASKAALRRSSSRCRSSATAPAAPRACAAFVPPRQLPQLQRDQPTTVLGHRARPQRRRSAPAAPASSRRAPSPPGRPDGRCRRAKHKGAAEQRARRPGGDVGRARRTRETSLKSFLQCKRQHSAPMHDLMPQTGAASTGHVRRRC